MVGTSPGLLVSFPLIFGFICGCRYSSDFQFQSVAVVLTSGLYDFIKVF